jgi:hypothetical protein
MNLGKLIFMFGIYSCTLLSLAGCKKDTYKNNGESIFFTGKSIDGRILQVLEKSQMKMVHGCANCHGNNGSGSDMMNKNPSIKYKDLTNPKLHKPVYNDELLIRFIDHELKSDSSIANTGVVWKMTAKDKTDIINFLKTL